MITCFFFLSLSLFFLLLQKRIYMLIRPTIPPVSDVAAASFCLAFYAHYVPR